MPTDGLVALNRNVSLQAVTLQGARTANFGTTLLQTAEIRPWLVGLQIADLGNLTQVPAAQSEAPITGAGGLRDTELLTSGDGATHYYLPRYRLHATGDRYSVSVDDDGDGRWWFRITLDLIAAPELGESWRTAQVLPGAVSGRLAFGSPVAQTLASGEQSEVEGGVALGFSMSLAERDALLWALKSEVGATLSVVRTVRVAVPVADEGSGPTKPWWTGPLHIQPYVLPRVAQPIPEPEPVVDLAQPDPAQPEPAQPDPVQPEPAQPDPAQPEPQPEPVRPQVLHGPDLITLEAFRAPTVARFAVARDLAATEAVTPQAVTPQAATAPVARLASLAVTGAATARIADDGGRATALALRRGGPLLQADALRDDAAVFSRARLRWRRPPQVPVPEAPMVRYVDSSPEQAVGLRFDPTVHPYVYPGAAGGRPATYERLQVADSSGRSHAYLRDPAAPAVFWYLPDAFRLGRTTTPPLRPALSFGIDQTDEDQGGGAPGEGGQGGAGQGGADDESTVTLYAQVVPAVDPARLAAAAQALAAQVPERDGTRPPVDLRPLQAPATLSLGLVDRPEGGDPGGGGGALDLVNGFLLTGSFPFDRFQDVYAALAATGDVSGMLRGTVAVNSGLPGADVVPIELRFASAVGGVLAASPHVDGDALVVRLRNASESPVRLLEVPVELRPPEGAGTEGAGSGGTTRVGDEEAGATLIPGPAATVTGPVYPADLPVDGEVELRVTLVPGSAPDPSTLQLRPGAVQALPDPAAVLALALDGRVDQEVDRELTVLTSPARLTKGTGEPPAPVETVVIELDGADVLTVDKDHLKVTAQVPVSLADVLLQRDGGGLIRYRQTLITTTGDTVADTEWRTTDRSLLVVPVT